MKEPIGPRFYGVYRAVVADVNDPLELDRVKLIIPELLGIEITEWAFPKNVAPGWSWRPAVGDRVWVEFEAGDPDRSVYSGTWYTAPGSKSEYPLPGKAKENYPTDRVITTPSGYAIQIKDGVPGENDTKKLSITTPSGHEITVDDTQGSESILIKHKDGTSKIEIDSTGKITINSADDILVQATGKVDIDGTVIELNTPTEGVVTGFPNGTWPTDSFTGAPIPGVPDVKAGVKAG